MRARLLAPLLLGLAGCAAPPLAATPQKPVLLEVPFFPDNTDKCGPSALASILRFWGNQTDSRHIKDEIYLAHLKGSLSVDLLLAAQSHGLSAEMLEGNWTRIKSEINAGHPLIAFVNRGFRFYPVGHYLVITGYDDQRQGIYAHSGTKRNAFMPYESFDRQWHKTDRWALLILPRKS